MEEEKNKDEKILDYKRDWERLKASLTFMDENLREAYLKSFILAKGRS